MEALGVYLPHNSTLEYDEHDKGEEGVIPVLVQTPQSNTENLEDKEGCYSMFFEKFLESRDGYIESVKSVILLCVLEV